MAHDYTNPRYLYQLATNGTPVERTSLANAMTGLLQSELTQSERDIAQDILLRLLEEADHELRCALAEKLAVEPKCPQGLLDYLIYQTPLDVAAPVLRYSEVLTDEYLLTVARHFKQSDYWEILAQRRHVSEDLSAFLVSTDDIRVCTSLLANRGALIGSHTMNTLMDMAPNVPEIHQPLMARPEMTPELARKLYKYVTVELRAEITQRFDISHKEIDSMLEQVVFQRLSGHYKVVTITPEMLDLCFKMKQQNKINSRQMIESAKKNDAAFFSCLWGALLDLNPEMVLEKLQTQLLVALPVLCHCARLSRADYNQLFLTWRQKNQQSVTNGTEMSQALKVFDMLKFEKAMALLNQWKAEGGTMPTPTQH